MEEQITPNVLSHKIIGAIKPVRGSVNRAALERQLNKMSHTGSFLWS